MVLGVSKHGINKEFDVLVQAMPELLRHRPSTTLELTGTVQESRWSQRSWDLARQIGVADRVRFVGDVPNRQVPGLVGSGRVLVFPTWCESFGLPLAEGLAMGAPAVAANIPACREVGGDAARFYQPGDSASLASSVLDLLDDGSARQALSASARRRGERFRWSDNAEGVHATLRRAAAA